MNGIEPLPGLDELQQRTDDLPVLCLASQHIANGRLDDAIQLLRPRRTSEALRRLLTNAYMRQGNVDAAVTELLEMAQRFSNVDHRVRAVEVLAGVGRLVDAAQLADETLPLVLPGRPERDLLHEVGVAAAHNSQDWPGMEARARGWINESGADRRRRWLLVMAVYNQADPDAAWRILQEAGADCPPESSIEAQLWIVLHARFRPSSTTLSEILQLAGRFPGDGDIRAAAVNAFILMGDGKGEVAPDELTQWHELIEDRAANPSPDDTFIAISVPDDPEGLIEAFRPFLEGQAQQVDNWIRKVRQESWPLGMLSIVAGRPYTKTLVQRPTGCLRIASTDSAVAAAETEAALEAIADGHVIADVSVLVVASYVRERWPQLLAAFAVVEITESSRRDAAISADDFHPRSNETLGWDLKTGRPTLHTTDDATLDRLESQLAWVHDQAAAMAVSASPTEEERAAADDFGPWMATFHAAQASGRPLWADDVGLRTLARNEGVPTFGTDALLRALASLARLTVEQVDSTVATLRDEYCVDFPVDEEWVTLAAERDQWAPGPALLVMSRPHLWAQPHDAFGLWSRLAEAAGADDLAKVAPWVYAAVAGIGPATADPERAVALAAGVLGKAATIVNLDPVAFASCAQAAAAGAADAGYADPTEFALAIVLDLVSQRQGPQEAAAIVARLGSELADEHREAVRRILFDL